METKYIRLTERGRAFAGWRGFVGCLFSIFGDRAGEAVFSWLYRYTWFPKETTPEKK